MESKTDQFDLAIVPEHLADKGCPYCDAKDNDKVMTQQMIEVFEQHQSDSATMIMQCRDCTHLYLITENPAFKNLKTHIYTIWRHNPIQLSLL